MILIVLLLIFFGIFILFLKHSNFRIWNPFKIYYIAENFQDAVDFANSNARFNEINTNKLITNELELTSNPLPENIKSRFDIVEEKVQGQLDQSLVDNLTNFFNQNYSYAPFPDN